MRKIILLGYMGSGKSTIAQRLSNSTGIPLMDLDKCIENRLNLSINEIFLQKGEIFFRQIEREIFIELLNSSQSQIIALGGGTPCYSNNHELLVGENRLSIYLKASVDTLVNRLSANKSKRPIIANKSKKELKEFVAKHLFDRSLYYNHAQCKVTIDGKTKDETAEEILKMLT